MKQTLLISMIVVAASIVSFGQDNKNTFPSPVISKEIHRVGLSKTAYVPVVLVTGQEVQASKAIARLNSKSIGKTRLVVTDGMPAHVISKGVARMQVERKN